MEKSRWNKDLREWIAEQFYTKDEVDERIDLYGVEVTIRYSDNTTERKTFYCKGD